MVEPSIPSLRKLAELTRSLPEGEEWNKAWQEALNGSDRLSALLATAWLDIQLETAIKSCFAKQVTQSDCNAYFGVQAPLSSFGAKRDMAFALGIYGRTTLEALKQIGKIRNIFAHAPSVVSFDTPELTIACRELGLIFQAYSSWEHLKLDEVSNTDKDSKTCNSARDNFLEASLIIYLSLSRRGLDKLLLDKERLNRQREDAKRLAELKKLPNENQPNPLDSLGALKELAFSLPTPYMP